jgi:hypothetical protein
MSQIDVPSQRLPSGFNAGSWLPMIKDQFELSTILLFGAALQCAMTFAPLTPIQKCAPALILLGLKTLNTAFMALNLKPDPHDAGVIKGKVKASFEGDSKHQGLVVFIIGFRVNHPLGFAAPGSHSSGARNPTETVLQAAPDSHLTSQT